MAPSKKPITDSQGLRELSDKELNEIMRAVGDRARAQTLEQKKKMKISLRKEINSARAAYLSYAKKNP
ncbi:MAG: hypothetical protein HY787_18250 [Deltaproteobacteria bacterium]|nr:hypothetical protein [Deltaproteobacteria bacterium]